MHAKKKYILEGVIKTFPLTLAASPVGFIYGALAQASELSAAAALAMSIFVYAGSAQFIAIGLIAAGSPLLVIILTTFVVNLRHLLYAAAIKDAVQAYSKGWRLVFGFGLTDETYAAIVSRYGQNVAAHAETQTSFAWFYLGSWLSMYLNWIGWTALGLVAGNQFPEIKTLGFDFAMVVTFVGIVIPLIRSKPYVVAAVTAGACSLLLLAMPYSLGLLFAACAGIAAGFAASQLKRV